MRRFFRIVKNTFYSLFAIIVLYLLASFILSIIPVNSNYHSPDNGVEIFIISNGVHTEIGFQVKQNLKKLGEITEGDNSNLTNSEYVSFGMGQREFYITTKTWADLKIRTALKATFIPSKAIMHVSYYQSRPIASNKLIFIVVSDSECANLLNYIENSFNYDFKGKAIPVVQEGKVYPEYFESLIYYHMFNTCNNWTNKAFKTTGIRTAFWSPFDKGILYQAKLINKN